MNMTGGPPQRIGSGVMVGVRVGVGVRVAVAVGVIVAVGVAVGELMRFATPQLIRPGRSMKQESK